MNPHTVKSETVNPSRLQWLAIAREAAMRGGCGPSQADEMIGQVRDWRDLVDERDFAHDWINSHKALIEACEYAKAVLGGIPAFGDTIGTEINKPMLGMARNKLTDALALANGRTPIDCALGDNATDSEREAWLRTHNTITGKPL